MTKQAREMSDDDTGGRVRTKKRRNGDMHEQLSEHLLRKGFEGLIEVETEMYGHGANRPAQGSVRRFQKGPDSRKKLKTEDGLGYKEIAEESSSADSPTITGDCSTYVKEQEKMATDKTAAGRTAAEEEMFQKGVEHGAAQARTEFNERTAEKAGEAVKGFWAKTKALAMANKGKLMLMVGVAGTLAAEATVAAVQERRTGRRTLNVGDTTVSWDTPNTMAGGGDGGRPQGAQPGNTNAAGNDGGGRGGAAGRGGGR